MSRSSRVWRSAWVCLSPVQEVQASRGVQGLAGQLAAAAPAPRCWPGCRARAPCPARAEARGAAPPARRAHLLRVLLHAAHLPPNECLRGCGGAAAGQGTSTPAAGARAPIHAGPPGAATRGARLVGGRRDRDVHLVAVHLPVLRRGGGRVEGAAGRGRWSACGPATRLQLHQRSILRPPSCSPTLPGHPPSPATHPHPPGTPTAPSPPTPPATPSCRQRWGSRCGCGQGGRARGGGRARQGRRQARAGEGGLATGRRQRCGSSPRHLGPPSQPPPRARAAHQPGASSSCTRRTSPLFQASLNASAAACILATCREGREARPPCGGRSQ